MTASTIILLATMAATTPVIVACQLSRRAYDRLRRGPWLLLTALVSIVGFAAAATLKSFGL